MKACWKKHSLHFKRPAETSRGTLHQRDVWYLFLTHKGVTGVGECAPLPNLGLDDISMIEPMLKKICAHPDNFLRDDLDLSNNPTLIKFPTILFALEMALLDLKNGGTGDYFPAREPENLNINGLIWMGKSDFMLSQIKEKMNKGWRCIKIKIGGIDFQEELALLKMIRERHSPDELELRLDANGAFTPQYAMEKLSQLAVFKPHSIEQPIACNQWDEMEKLCKNSPIPIALDEELLQITAQEERATMLEKIKPQYIVLKPGLLGGFSKAEKWITLAKKRNIGWWVTSALESNIGLNAITQWTQNIAPKGFQGLGTGQLFTNNIPVSLHIKAGKLSHQKEGIWNEIHQLYVEWLSPTSTMELRTSGSTGKPKTISLPKEWIENSARLTAETLNIKAGDKALLCLPPHYIAGKMMALRALINGWDFKIIKPSTNPLASISETIDFAAMTPMQLTRSIENGHIEKVKTLIVGGARVSQNLIEQLQSTDTNIYETWGMTETVSHIALRRLNGYNRSEEFHALRGVSFKVDKRGCLIITATQFDNKTFTTNDMVELIDRHTFKWLGRHDNIINSGGVKIIPEEVERKLSKGLSHRHYYITAMSDDELGQKVALFIEGKEEALTQDIWKPLNRFEKPKTVTFVDKFKRTDSGKVQRIKIT